MYSLPACFPALPFKPSPAFMEWLALLPAPKPKLYPTATKAVPKSNRPTTETKPQGDQMQTGLQLGLEGANSAAQHADRLTDGGFTVAAAAAFRRYAATHDEFTSEDVRLCCAEVPNAPDARAWGAVARAAVRAGVCKSVGIGRSKSPGCHGSWVTVYRSLIIHGC